MAEPLKIAMVTDVCGVNDQSFNQSAWEGLLRAQKELGVKIAYKESRQDEDYGLNIATLTDAGYDLIWGLGFSMRDAILSTAQVNPDQKYGIIDFSYGPDTPVNVGCVVFQEEQPSFLVGYIAGKMTRTNKVGFVGGIKFPLIEKFEYGYMAGVKLANPACDILSEYAKSFTDAAKGKTIASHMYQQGADIVFHASGSVGDGVGIAPTSDRHVPRTVLDETDDLIRKIKSGALVVPSTRETYESFIK